MCWHFDSILFIIAGFIIAQVGREQKEKQTEYL